MRLDELYIIYSAVEFSTPIGQMLFYNRQQLQTQVLDVPHVLEFKMII